MTTATATPTPTPLSLVRLPDAQAPTTMGTGFIQTVIRTIFKGEGVIETVFEYREILGHQPEDTAITQVIERCRVVEEAGGALRAYGPTRPLPEAVEVLSVREMLRIHRENVDHMEAAAD